MNLKIKGSVSLLAIQLMMGCYQAEAFSEEAAEAATWGTTAVTATACSASVGRPACNNQPVSRPSVPATPAMAGDFNSVTPERIGIKPLKVNHKYNLGNIAEEILQSMRTAGLTVEDNEENRRKALIAYYKTSAVPETVEELQAAELRKEDFDLALSLTNKKKKQKAFQSAGNNGQNPVPVETQREALRTFIKYQERIVTQQKIDEMKRILANHKEAQNFLPELPKLEGSFSLASSQFSQKERNAFENCQKILAQLAKDEEKKAKKTAKPAAVPASIPSSTDADSSTPSTNAALAAAAPTVDSVKELLDKLDQKSKKSFEPERLALMRKLVIGEAFSKSDAKTIAKATKAIATKAPQAK